MTSLNAQEFGEMLEGLKDYQDESRQFLLSRGWRKADDSDRIDDKWAGKNVETWVHPSGEFYPLCQLFGTEKEQAIIVAEQELLKELGWVVCGTLSYHPHFEKKHPGDEDHCDDYQMAAFIHPESGKLYGWFEAIEIARELNNDDSRLPYDHLCGKTQEIHKILDGKTVENNDVVDLNFLPDENGDHHYHFRGIRKSPH